MVVGIGRSFGDMAGGNSVPAKVYQAIMDGAKTTTLAIDVFPGGESFTRHVCKMDISWSQCIA